MDIRKKCISVVMNSILFVVLITCLGCSPVPFPYLRRVPAGIKQICVKDAESNSAIENAKVEILYSKIEQSCMPYKPFLYSDTFVSQHNPFLPPNIEVREKYNKKINVKNISPGRFSVDSKNELASVQPLWVPALPHTIFNDYEVFIIVDAEGYYPLRLWYYSLEIPCEKIVVDDKGWIELKNGSLLVMLKHKEKFLGNENLNDK